MDTVKSQFATRLRAALEAAGYPARPAVLEREFNTRYFGKPMTLHGVRRWLRGETLPSREKLLVLGEWLGVPPEELCYGSEVGTRIEARQNRWQRAIGYEEREIFEAFLRLPVPQRRVVREVILAFARAYPAEHSSLAD